MSEVTRAISSLPHGTGFSRFVSLLVKSNGRAFQALDALNEPIDPRVPDLTLERAWRSTPQVRHCLELRTKAATTPGTTTGADWAAPLAQSGIASEAITFMRGVSILGSLESRCRRVPFNVKIPREVNDVTLGDWVAEAAPTPAASLSFDQVGPLTSTKVGTISAWTKEFAISAIPTAQALVRQGVLGGLAKKIDQQLLDPSVAAVANVKPASLTQGVSPVTSTGATAAAISADLNVMLASITTTGSGLTWVLRPKTASTIAGALGATSDLPRSLLALPVIISANAPQQVTLIDCAAVLLADDGEFDVDLSEQAIVQLDSAPTSPVVAGTILQSFWSDNLVGLRARRWVHWLVARPGAVSYMVTVY